MAKHLIVKAIESGSALGLQNQLDEFLKEKKLTPDNIYLIEQSASTYNGKSNWLVTIWYSET